jgi:benzoate/toluate 1,2-dioxygenase beta subunit
MYWVPQQRSQVSPYDHISLSWDDAMLREVRARRLENPRNWSQQPPTLATRTVGNIQVVGCDRGGFLVVRSTLQMTESRRATRQLAGTIWHKLHRAGDEFRIQMKRVDLVNCEAAHENLELFI